MPVSSYLFAALPVALQAGTPELSISAPQAQDQAIEISQSKIKPSQESQAAADDLPNSYPYVSIQAGVGFPNDLKGKFSLVNFPQIPPAQNTLDLNTGFNGELAVGYKFPNFRTDLSVGYSTFNSQTQTLVFTNNNNQTLSLTNPGKGSVDLFTVMANAYYDFKIKNKDNTLSRWSPYIGAGIGWGNLSTPQCAIPNCTTFSGGNASTFVYQAKLGLAYRATQSGFVFLEAGYLGTTATTVSNVSYDPLGAVRLNLGWLQRF